MKKGYLIRSGDIVRIKSYYMSYTWKCISTRNYNGEILFRLGEEDKVECCLYLRLKDYNWYYREAGYKRLGGGVKEVWCNEKRLLLKEGR